MATLQQYRAGVQALVQMGYSPRRLFRLAKTYGMDAFARYADQSSSSGSSGGGGVSGSARAGFGAPNTGQGFGDVLSGVGSVASGAATGGPGGAAVAALGIVARDLAQGKAKKTGPIPNTGPPLPSEVPDGACNSNIWNTVDVMQHCLWYGKKGTDLPRDFTKCFHGVAKFDEKKRNLPTNVQRGIYDVIKASVTYNGMLSVFWLWTYGTIKAARNVNGALLPTIRNASVEGFKQGKNPGKLASRLDKAFTDVASWIARTRPAVQGSADKQASVGQWMKQLRGRTHLFGGKSGWLSIGLAGATTTRWISFNKERNLFQSPRPTAVAAPWVNEKYTYSLKNQGMSSQIRDWTIRLAPATRRLAQLLNEQG